MCKYDFNDIQGFSKIKIKLHFSTTTRVFNVIPKWTLQTGIIVEYKLELKYFT